MKKIFLNKCLIFFGLLLFFTFLPQIMPTNVSIARASEIEKEKNNEPRLNLSAITIVNGKSFTLRVYNLDKDIKVSFKSADSDIASVSEDGILTANKSGSTTITATLGKGLNPTLLTCDITVGPPAFSVKLTRSRTILEVDQIVQLEALIKPINTVESVKFLSDDKTIATVSPGGRVTAKKLGSTIVSAKIDALNQDGEQKSSRCSVIVAKPEDIILLDNYFALHPELNDIPETELFDALVEIINEYYGEKEEVNNPSLTSTSSEEQKSKSGSIADTAPKSTDAKATDTAPTTNDTGNKPADTASKAIDTAPKSVDTASKATDIGTKLTDTATKVSTPTVNSNTSLANGETTGSSPAAAQLSLIETLDKQLNSKFNLSELKQKYDERFSTLTIIQLSSLHGLGNMIKR